MTQAQHTAGKWTVAKRGDGNQQLPILAGHRIIAAVRDHGSLADARLIAASPDLLAACDEACRTFGDIERHPTLASNGQTAQAMRTVLNVALKKATGND